MVQFKKNSSIRRPYLGAEYRRTGFTESTPSSSDSEETSYGVVVSGFSDGPSRLTSPFCGCDVSRKCDDKRVTCGTYSNFDHTSDEDISRVERLLDVEGCFPPPTVIVERSTLKVQGHSEMTKISNSITGDLLDSLRFRVV